MTVADSHSVLLFLEQCLQNDIIWPVAWTALDCPLTIIIDTSESFLLAGNSIQRTEHLQWTMSDESSEH